MIEVTDIVTNEGFKTIDYDGQLLWWSGKNNPPEIGQAVEINFNQFGKGKVEGYFGMEGFLGVIVRLEKLPAWYVKQHKGKPFYGTARVFGTEINY